MHVTLTFAASLLIPAGSLATVSASPALPSTLYEEWRISPAPANGSPVTINPPALQWASVQHWENKPAIYTVELSSDSSFPVDRTIRSVEQSWCFFNPHRKLVPGTWFWRYTIMSQGHSTVKGPFSFVVTDGVPVFESPDFKVFAANVPKRHPVMVTEGVELATVRRNAASHPLAVGIIERGRKISADEVYSGPVSSNDLAEERRLSRVASKETSALAALVDAYLLSGDATLKDAIMKRIDVISGWWDPLESTCRHASLSIL